MIQVSSNGDLKALEFLIENGTDLNTIDKDGCTALISASRTGNLKIIQLYSDIS